MPDYYEGQESAKVPLINGVNMSSRNIAVTVRDRIEMQIAQLDVHKEQLLKFRDLLDKNPDTEQILNLSRQVGI